MSLTLTPQSINQGSSLWVRAMTLPSNKHPLFDSALRPSFRTSHRHHRGRVLLYFTHSYCFPKTTTWWQAGETTNPSSFCPQTDCLGIKITTVDSVQGAKVAKLYSWVCLPKHFTVNFFSIYILLTRPPVVELNGERLSVHNNVTQEWTLDWTGLGLEGFVCVCLCVWHESQARLGSI